MNILARELRAGLKAFAFWMIGMFALCFIGIIKYQSYTVSGSMTELLASFPRVVLAVMGVVGVDFGTIEGYTALLFYYVAICAAVYAVHLGSDAVSRETVDKTYEFVFTKPCSRAYVLGMKLASAYLYLLLFCVFNAFFSVLAVDSLKTAAPIHPQIWLSALAVFLIGGMFLAASALFAAEAERAERGAVYGNLALLCAFVLGVAYNAIENPGLLRLIAPLNYFAPAELIAVRLDPAYTALALALTSAFLWGAFAKFKRKDLL